jgi:hypothetical protein
VRPAAPRTIEYGVVDTMVKRIGADTAPIPTKRDPTQAGNKKKK